MRHFIVIGILLTNTTILSVGSVDAGDHFFYSRRHACNQRCLPNFSYQHDTPRFSATELAVANPVTSAGVRQHKPFHFRSISLDKDHLHLDQVGLALYKVGGSKQLNLGTIVATGRITNDGGDGSIVGSNVTIRIRAYVAATADPNQIPADAFVVWESKKNIWVRRGNPQHISLVPKNLSQSEKLNMHFTDITHLEVELEYQRDR